MRSPMFSLTKSDAKSLLRGLCVSILGVSLAYVAATVIPQLEASAMSPQSALLVMLLSNAVNLAQRFVREIK